MKADPPQINSIQRSRSCRVATPRNNEAGKCDKVKADERRSEVVNSLSNKLVEESDPSRTDVPETVALAFRQKKAEENGSDRADSRRSRPERDSK